MTTVVERNEHGWLDRLMRVVTGLGWLALIVATVGTISDLGISTETVGAALLSGAYVIGIQTMPSAWIRRKGATTILVSMGTVLTSVSASLTGGFDSPYVLLVTTPIIIGAMTGGARIALAAVALAVATVTVSGGGASSVEQIFSWTGLQMLVATTFAFARRLIVEALEEASLMTLVSAETGAQLERLQHTNKLLQELSGMTYASELDAVAIGEAALESVRSTVPYRAAAFTFFDSTGPILLARKGVLSQATELPLSANGHQVARLQISTDQPLTARQTTGLQELLAPACVALTNILLLQDIAKTAISEERLRVARELHDGIGPELAALGLAIDIAAMQSSPGSTPEHAMRDMRSTVTRLVREVRSTVADLRSGDDRSVASLLQDLTEEIPELAGKLTSDVKEAGEARPFVAIEINAIITESIRNALRHANASQVNVRGFVARTHGNITISDNGHGYNPDEIPSGHFGVIGMKERAATISGTLAIESIPGRGTEVTVRWKDSSL